jgi:hypothetical protein
MQNNRLGLTTLELCYVFIALLAGLAFLVGGVGAVTALSGDTLGSIPALVLVPLYSLFKLLRWKLAEDAIDPIAASAILGWLCGAILGCITWYVKVVLLGA